MWSKVLHELFNDLNSFVVDHGKCMSKAGDHKDNVYSKKL